MIGGLDFVMRSKVNMDSVKDKEVLRDLMPKAILKGDIAFKMSDTLNSE